MTIAAGGAVSESRESRLINDARSAEGRCLKVWKFNNGNGWHQVEPTLSSETAQSIGKIWLGASDEAHSDPGMRKDAYRKMGSHYLI